jgi:drug/metabolite transporter (DMT)-like permease
LNLGVPLGLSSGLCWGAADFFGGIQSRRLPALTVAFWSQVAGALALAIALAIEGVRPAATGVAWGLAAGLGSGCALLLFYRGLAEGTMSIVAPISACGAIIPVTASLLTGNHPGTLAALGVLTAITGVILVSRPHPATPPQPKQDDREVGPANAAGGTHPVGTETGAPPAAVGATPAGVGGTSPAAMGGATPAGVGGATPGRGGRVVAMALGSALGFGLFYVFVDAGTAAGAGTTGSRGSPLWVIAGARMSSLVILSTIALVSRGSALRWPGRRVGAVALVGLGDTGANLLFAYAATTGNLAVVGVLGSLYPVATVVLARWLLGERLSGGQNAGVVLALTGVGLLAAA